MYFRQLFLVKITFIDFLLGFIELIFDVLQSPLPLKYQNKQKQTKGTFIPTWFSYFIQYWFISSTASYKDWYIRLLESTLSICMRIFLLFSKQLNRWWFCCRLFSWQAIWFWYLKKPSISQKPRRWKELSASSICGQIVKPRRLRCRGFTIMTTGLHKTVILKRLTIF